MAALSILGYGFSQGITISTKTITSSTDSMSSSLTNQQQEVANHSKTFSKITVQNVLSDNRNSINISNNSGPSLNSANAIVRKIKDFGMVGAVNNSGTSGSNVTNSVSKSLLIRKRLLTDSKNNSNEGIKSTLQVPKKLKQTKESKAVKEQSTVKVPKKLNNENRPKKALNALNTSTDGSIVKPAGTPGRKGLPLPQAVARRNARERNRVKQVNNGFAALRERIPEEVAEAFESQGTSRGSSIKKLSKVETLRMAVEYIRSLERLLGFDFSVEQRDSIGQQYSGSSGEDSYSIIKDEFDTLSPNMDDNFEDSMSHYDMDDYFSTSGNNNTNSTQNETVDTNLNSTNPIDLLPNITTLHGLQYIRIPGTSTYQLLTPDIFVGSTHSPPNSSLDDEQFNSLIDTNRLSPTGIGLTLQSQSQSRPQTTNSPLIDIPVTTATTTTTSMVRTTETVMTAPASPNNSSAVNNSMFENGKPVAVPLSRLTPVPQMLPTTSSPNAGTSSSSLYRQQQQTTGTLQATKLSPAVNEQPSQACATTNTTEVQSHFVAPNLPHLLPHLIKQEYGEAVDFDSNTKSPDAIAMNNVYQTTQAAGEHHEHATISISPPLDNCNRLLIAPQHASTIELQSFYEQEDSASFYDNNLSFKKDLEDVLLDASSATNTGLSDESMIESIDWWEVQHTPQSDGNGAVML